MAFLFFCLGRLSDEARARARGASDCELEGGLDVELAGRLSHVCDEKISFRKIDEGRARDRAQRTSSTTTLLWTTIVSAHHNAPWR